MIVIPTFFEECTFLAEKESVENLENYYKTNSDNIRKGKLAELFIVFNSNNFHYPILQGARIGCQYPDAGYDLIINSQKIQVKSVEENCFSTPNVRQHQKLVDFLEEDSSNILLIYQRSTACVFEMNKDDLSKFRKSKLNDGYYLYLSVLKESSKYSFDVRRENYIIH